MNNAGRTGSLEQNCYGSDSEYYRQ